MSNESYQSRHRPEPTRPPGIPDDWVTRQHAEEVDLQITPYKLRKYLAELASVYPDQMRIFGKVGYISPQLVQAIAMREAAITNAVAERAAGTLLYTAEELQAALGLRHAQRVELIALYPAQQGDTQPAENRRGLITTHYTQAYVDRLRQAKVAARTAGQLSGAKRQRPPAVRTPAAEAAKPISRQPAEADDAPRQLSDQEKTNLLNDIIAARNQLWSTYMGVPVRPMGNIRYSADKVLTQFDPLETAVRAGALSRQQLHLIEEFCDLAESLASRYRELFT